jgi:hypothetical protein
MEDSLSAAQNLSTGEWIALAGFALALLGLLTRGIWSLSKLESKVGTMAGDMTVMINELRLHASQCDTDRVRFETQIGDHSRRIDKLEDEPESG